MTRRLLNLLTALSLLVCVAACVLWVRSRFAADCYLTDRLGALSADGSVVLLWGHGAGLQIDPEERGFRTWPLPDAGFGLAMRFGPGGMRGWDVGGLAYYHAAPARGWTQRLSFPSLSLAILFALSPLAWAVRKVIRQQRPRGHRLCRSCGYDLRATPDRCPECGSPV
jgi:hypothetical protein